MKMRLVFLALLLSVSQVSGQQMDNPPARGDWEFVVAPYLLMGSVSGDASIGVAGPSEVDLKFGDILKKLQFAFMLRGEAYKGDWGVIADYFYMKLGDDIDTPQEVVADIEFRQTIFEFFLSRRFRKDWGWFDVYGGIRYWDFGIDLNLEGLQVTRVSFKQDWLDPVVGGRAVLVFSDRFRAVFRGDVGGFGVGSDFSFTVQPGLGYAVSDWFAVMLQYKYLYADYNNDKQPPDLFVFDAATSGPLLGLVFQF